MKTPVIFSTQAHILNKLEGKMVYISDNIVYAFPTGEKMFFGNASYGSYIIVG